MNTIEFINAYSSVTQALATVILVVLTVYYVRQVRRSASEMETARKSEFMPILTIRAEASAEKVLDIYLSNIGKGLAQHATVILPFEREAQVAERVASGEENVLVTFEELGTKEIFEIPEEKRVLRVEYLDIFGQKIVSEATLIAEETETGEVLQERLRTKNWRVILPKDVSNDDL